MRYAEVMVYFQGEKNGKKTFSNSRFFVIVERQQHPSEGEKNAANQHKPIRQ